RGVRQRVGGLAKLLAHGGGLLQRVDQRLGLPDDRVQLSEPLEAIGLQRINLALGLLESLLRGFLRGANSALRLLLRLPADRGGGLLGRGRRRPAPLAAADRRAGGRRCRRAPRDRPPAPSPRSRPGPRAARRRRRPPPGFPRPWPRARRVRTPRAPCRARPARSA